jgi:hypothetical protein
MNINRANDGFIKLSYQLRYSDLWSDNNGWLVFIKMVLAAHFEDDFTSIRFGGKQVYLKRGEFACSMSELSTITNVSVGTLRDVLLRLEASKRIGKRTDRQTTIYSICNYDKYQDSPERKNRRVAANDPTNGTTNDPTNVTEGKKNIKNIKNNKHMSSDDELLKLLNEATKRSFRVLPKSANATVQKFSVDEIKTALGKMMNDPWHKTKADVLSSDYMLRVSTIDKFLSANDTATKYEKSFGAPTERVKPDNLNLSRKQLAAMEYKS